MKLFNSDRTKGIILILIGIFFTVFFYLTTNKAMLYLYLLPAFFCVFGFACIRSTLEGKCSKTRKAPVKGKALEIIKNIIIVFFSAWAIILLITMVLMTLRFFPHPS